MSRILIAEDDVRVAQFIASGLITEGFITEAVEDGERAVDRALSGDVDLLILDVGLPGIDGFEVLRRLRGQGSDLPIVMLTARNSAQDAVDGLTAGANDYVRKPFAFDELLARVRSRIHEQAPASGVTIAHGGVQLNALSRRALIDGREIDLSAREFALAEHFMRHPGQILSREQLLSAVWGLDFDPGSNIVDVYVRYLRTKFGPERIKTVRGSGYRWE